MELNQKNFKRAVLQRTVCFVRSRQAKYVIMAIRDSITTLEI